ncbi:MAG: hypothetical protein ABIY70_00965 [Capsulimonas sp.]|uniref:hypothetical protein n=1 Tax=Capsulimonas sp. TaxID=2494211 RepID=UPI003265DFCC
MSRTVRISASSSDAVLLVAFLDGDNLARELFVQRFHAKFVKLIGSTLASDLGARGLAEDAVQRFWVLLLAKSPSYFTLGGAEVTTHLRRLLLTAARDVRADYKGTFAPRKTKVPITLNGNTVSPAQAMEAASTEKSWRPDLSLEGIVPELIPDEKDEIKRFLSKADAELRLQNIALTAKRPIPQVLNLVYYDGMQLTEATRVYHIHHATFRRRMQSYNLRTGATAF